jgi:hypothetical protein
MRDADTHFCSKLHSSPSFPSTPLNVWFAVCTPALTSTVAIPDTSMPPLPIGSFYGALSDLLVDTCAYWFILWRTTSLFLLQLQWLYLLQLQFRGHVGLIATTSSTSLYL